MKNAGLGDGLNNLNYGSDVQMDGMDVDRTAVKIPPMPQKKFGQNAGIPTATGETQTSLEMED